MASEENGQHELKAEKGSEQKLRRLADQGVREQEWSLPVATARAEITLGGRSSVIGGGRSVGTALFKNHYEPRIIRGPVPTSLNPKFTILPIPRNPDNLFYYFSYHCITQGVNGRVWEVF